MFGVKDFAFLKLDVQLKSRSADMELLALLAVVVELAALPLSRALRSRRWPTVSVPGSLHERSAVNILSHDE